MRGTWLTLTRGTPCEPVVENHPTRGRFAFLFNQDFTAFDGTFSVCEQPLGRKWTGTKIADLPIPIQDQRPD